MSRTHQILSKLFLAACLSACSSGEPHNNKTNEADARDMALNSKQREALKCYEREQGTMEVVDLDENRRLRVTDDYKQAVLLWRNARSLYSAAFRTEQDKPSARSSFKPTLAENEALIVIGCTDWTGTDSYNFDLSLKRAQHMAEHLGGFVPQEKICTVPLGEYCDELGITSDLKNFSDPHDPSEQRFVRVSKYKIYSDEEWQQQHP